MFGKAWFSLLMAGVMALSSSSLLSIYPAAGRVENAIGNGNAEILELAGGNTYEENVDLPHVNLASLPRSNQMKITKDLTDVTVYVGDTVRFSIEVQGDGLTYQWYYKMAGEELYSPWSGRNTKSFDLTVKKSHDRMKAYCVVKDASGKKISSKVMTLTVRTQLKIIKEPKDIRVEPEQTVQYEVKVQGDGLVYQWYYKLPGQGSFVRWNGKTEASVSLTSSEKKDGLQVCCVIKDVDKHTVTSRTAQLTVMTPLKWTLQPDVSEAWYGKHVALSAKASGDDVTYQWYYKSASASSFKVWSGRTEANLDFVPSEADNQMQIYCQAKDRYGRKITSQTITLTVKTPVKIKEQPQDIKGIEGQTSVFRITAIGDGLQYQWYFKKKDASEYSRWDGKNSASFSYKPTLDKDGMQIYCEVSDQYGNKVKSDLITLSVKIMEVGDFVTFGFYEQDNNTSNGKEPIEWIVLEIEEDKVLLMSRYSLDAVPYHTQCEKITWENSSLRSWLGTDFISKAFNTDQQKKILTTPVSAEKISHYSTDPGKSTEDKVFLLSIQEVNQYLSTDETRKCAPTAYAMAQGAYASKYDEIDGQGSGWWWLRSPGDHSNLYAACIDSEGCISPCGDNVENPNDGVRPVLWLDLNS